VIATYAATLFGIGRSPVAPGTVASIVALPIAWLVMSLGGPVALMSLALVTAGLGMWACDLYAKDKGAHDPSECVIDEMVGQFLACALAPLSVWGFALAFLLFRLFDISKLWPISEAEKLRGGIGIVADDVVAGLMAGLVVAIFATAGLL
jgi:phosphatidylglycerophosphatase A